MNDELNIAALRVDRCPKPIMKNKRLKDSLKFLDRNDIYFLLHGIYTYLQGFHAGNNSSLISAGGRVHTFILNRKVSMYLQIFQGQRGTLTLFFFFLDSIRK
jgi:hypothetical protein